jgi:actin-related protein 9
MEAFLAFLEHVHSQLTTTYHNTPIMLVASPQWTRPDCEAIARYVFEKTKTPALCLIHSGIATQYGLKWPNMTVVDVGFEKVDVTCIYDGKVVSHKDVGPAAEEEISGGEVFTRRLAKLMERQGFDHEMAEQLKKSAICEVLPYAPDMPELAEFPAEAGAAAPVARVADGPKIVEPAKSFAPVIVDDDVTGVGDTEKIEEDGVLDVANIVASGQTREFLAKKEKEKAAKAGRKGKDKEGADAGKLVRLPNSKRAKAVFHYDELVTEEVPVAAPAKEGGGGRDAAMANSAATEGSEPAEQQPQPSNEAQASDAVQPATTERVARRVRRDIEVGLERFRFADRKAIDRIVTAIYRAIQEIEDMYMRPGCWENIVFVGNGARARGLRDNIMQTLQARHLVSPSSATMFTSELPSNMGTPSGTGSQTPTSSYAGIPGQLQLPTATSSGVNPLLQAATTASSLGVPGNVNAATANNVNGVEVGAVGTTSYHFHSQTPTNIRLAQLPGYLSDWSKHGFEEAMFLGAQVAARIAFCMHNLDAQGLQAQQLMALSRVDYK